MSPNAAKRFVDQIETLPPLRPVVQQILAITESPHSSADQVAKALSRDQAVAAKVLRVTNSPFYGMRRKVTEVSRAVVILGTTTVRNLVIGMCARDALPVHGSAPAEYTALWQHSIAVAAGCEMTARRIHHSPEEAFIVGLLHDIGQLAMVVFDPALFLAVQDEKGEAPFLRREEDAFGVNHAEAGFRILTRWGLPEPLCQVILKHHDDACHPAELQQLLAMVTVADLFAIVAGYGIDHGVKLLSRTLECLNVLRLTAAADQVALFESLDSRVMEVAEMLGDRGPAAGGGEAPSRKLRIAWVRSRTGGSGGIWESLVSRRAQQVRHVELSDDLPLLDDEEVAVIDLEPGKASLADDVARRLAAREHPRIVVLTDPEPSVPRRRWDPVNGICRIPRLFTLFDLTFLEERFLYAPCGAIG